MPAAAVIPAPIAYINVVAVKKLVVEVRECVFMRASLSVHNLPPPIGVVGYSVISLLLWSFTVRKLECSKRAFV